MSVADGAEDLAALRAQIDAVDAQLAALLVQRAELVKAVWSRKQQAGAAVLDPDREQQIVAHYANSCPQLQPADVERFVRGVLRVRAR